VVTEVVLPQMGLEVSEGTVTAILVAVGDAVAEGQTVAEVETDKAIAEIPATRDGVVVAVEIEVGDVVPVGANLMQIGDSVDEGAPVAQIRGGGNGDRGFTADGSGRRRAAPIARRAAGELGVSLELIAGTGPAGRITLGDVERAAAERGAASTTAASSQASVVQTSSGERLEPLSATRQAIARRLGESQLVPQYTLARDVDASWLLAEKERLTATGPTKVGVVDLLLAGLAEALARHPRLAASFVPGEGGEPPAFRHPDGIDLGLAVASDRGLLVPVIRGAHERTLPELVLERARLVELTRAGRLGLADMGAAAATLSSLGTFGVDQFTAMLNPGESAILAVGRTVEKVVPSDRGLAVVPTLTCTFTFDHRVVDGAVGGAALSELAELLEGGIEWRI
jgi:pyruvate dehydrogenase E2 component (dihydrolipoamide acetyltransferase)